MIDGEVLPAMSEVRPTEGVYVAVMESSLPEGRQRQPAWPVPQEI